MLFWLLVAVFAYVGGLVVFLSSLFKIVLHYSLRAIFLFIHWYHVKLTSREGHRMALDLPQMPGQENCVLYASIQEPFLYVEGAGQNEAEVIDDSLHCHLNSSIDTCRNVDDGDSIVDVLTWHGHDVTVKFNQSLQFAFTSSIKTLVIILTATLSWKGSNYASEKITQLNYSSNPYVYLTTHIRPFNSCVLSSLAFVWKWGWSWPCFDRNLTDFLM